MLADLVLLARDTTVNDITQMKLKGAFTTLQDRGIKIKEYKKLTELDGQ
jgi:hypothetical protein